MGRRNSGGPVVCLDWGIDIPILVFSNGEVRPVTLYNKLSFKPTEKKATQKLSALMDNENALFLIRPKVISTFDKPLEILADQLAVRGRYASVIRTFYDKNGLEVICVLKIDPAHKY